jgi:hypothetical protein
MNYKLGIILKQAYVAQSRYDSIILPGKDEDNEEISVRIIDFLIKIPKGNSPKTSLGHCRYSSLLNGKL